MLRSEKIYKELKLLCEDITLERFKEGFCGFDATTIGERISINRTNTSKELNFLVSQKRIIKVHGRPVYFLDRSKVEEILDIKLNDIYLEIDSIDKLLSLKKETRKNDITNEDVFEKIIGSGGSLEVAIKQAKAAVLYPPNGLHTLIIGPTGVGKTTFAEKMYSYAKRIGRIDSNAEFTIFNCAEYADNPQLLLSQLFGYVKGAFTGAEKDKVGIIEKANGGILLLDEVHRLTPEGQEMLFLLMDKNIYRRLGETDNTREANVLLIGATTEDIKSTLLKTFLRRIPMIIKLPSLSDRAITERLQLIEQFFKDEVKRVKVPIRVYKDVMKALLLYDCQGNIGQLKGDIQLTCARGFLNYKADKKNLIEIDTPLIPDHIYQGLFNYKNRRDEIINLLHLDNKKYYEFSESNKEEFASIDDYNISEDLYKEISEKYYSYLKRGYSQSQINEALNGHLEKYLKKLLKKCNAEMKMPENEELFKIVSPRVYNAVENGLKVAEQKLNKRFSKKVYIALTMHISALMERISENKIVSNYELNEIALNNPDEFNTAKLIREILEKELEIRIPVEEIGFIAMFLYAVDSDEKRKNSRIGIVVLAHGKYTASSIADVANSLLGTDHCKAIDMPLDEKVEVALEKATEMVEKVDEGKGVLMLVDMGSLAAFSEIITKKTNKHTRSVEMVSTPMVIEAVRKCFLPEMTLESLAEDIQKISPYVGRLVTNNMKNKASIIEPRTIITTCLTGEGSALKLAQLLKSSLPIIDEYNIIFNPMNLDKFTRIDSSELRNVLTVVGTVDLKIPDVPYIPIDDLIIGDGLKIIKKMISGVDEVDSQEQLSELDLIIKVLEDTLIFLNPSKAHNAVINSFKKISDTIKIKDYKKLEIRYLFHCCFMIERLIKKQAMTYSNVIVIIQSNKKLYRIIKNSLEGIEEMFGIEIPDTEIGYIIDLLDTQ